MNQLAQKPERALQRRSVSGCNSFQTVAVFLAHLHVKQEAGIPFIS